MYQMQVRPLVLIQAATEDGNEHSVMLQNAETVKLVGPDDSGNEGDITDTWRAISVSELKIGDEIFVHRQSEARHTGVAINEQIVER